MTDPTLESNTTAFIEVATIGAAYGLKGWVKIVSYTDPKSNLLDYSPWYLKIQNSWKIAKLEQSREHGKIIVALFAGYSDRTQAESLKHTTIAVKRDQLPKQKKDEYYWIDLIGVRVKTIDNIELGYVERIMETGANDVLSVNETIANNKVKTRLIPFIQPQVVTKIDLDANLMIVDWDPDF